ncbi:hypothetical protein C666_01690 [Thauera linaloolentis 47Lol = DSM 12138]|uniref:Uncharacterized protein n=1 Tax=Thauera linaloolentis (strain DSM 12138 / JCM 21573 / CCUG 41526 / CIP 105981 / IAM 15112 / NBRC 102519 / 47Lol) TaxID=1123367 RepID=N6Y7V9_THAL4|nr:hypothetical protein C666_01690 [Thauera linaloolentis 47Lol = DSM 12138]
MGQFFQTRRPASCSIHVALEVFETPGFDGFGRFTKNLYCAFAELVGFPPQRVQKKKLPVEGRAVFLQPGKRPMDCLNRRLLSHQICNRP